MSTSPSFPLNNDLNDRPLSVYDNLTSNQTPNGVSKEYPKPTTITNGDPLKNITFKFDDNGLTSNGGTPYPGSKVPDHQSPPVIRTANSVSRNSPAKTLISANAAPGVNCNNVDVSKTSQRLAATTVSPTNNVAPLTSKSPSRSVAIDKSTIMSDFARGGDQGSATGTSHFKPVISDAKSRFFGLTDTRDPSSDRNTSSEDRSESVSVPLLDDSYGHQQVKISPPVLDTAASEHKYQNIPPNSAIFRKLNDPAANNANDVIDAIAMSPQPVSAPSTTPTIVTTDLSPAENNDDLSEKSRLNSDDLQSNRRRNTNSFHADTDLNYNQQPSQVIYMSTTVPQNIKSPNIAGRHTPTRNSLRHSRMLVVNKNYQGLESINPLGLRHPRLARILLILLLILGLIITTIGIWILLWAPYTRMQDNPYWSGLSLILAGTLGLIVIKFRRIKRQKVREHCFTFLKADSLMLTIIACILCLAAFTCASLHLNNLFSPTTKCASTNIFIANASCICIFGAKDTNFTPPNGTEPANRAEELFSGGYEFHYKDLSCNEVNGAWRYLLMASIVLNVLGFFIGSCYLLLSCFKKKDKRKIYNSVRTDVF